MFGQLRVPSRPIDLSGLPFGPMGCATYLENQILLRRFDAGGTLPADWLSQTVSKARQVGRSLANQEARAVLHSWLESECAGSGDSGAATPDRVRAAYEALLVQEAVINMWDMPYYTGIPCPKLMMNLVLQERQAGRPFAGWDSWFDRARVARERSRSGPPATAVPPAGGSAPPPSRSDDFSGGDRRPPPDVPHCRYHPWCRG
ncbi:MAG: hypothetical protein HYV15_00375 [Elusimicrobia bacterium]|nr:hypothetical protein [Elusimicrobiota bacterium]